MNELYEIDLRDKASYDGSKSLRDKRLEIEQHAAQKFLSGRDLFAYKGYCLVCEQESLFSIDWLYAQKPMPNWRERLVCSGCNLSNRQRYIMYLLVSSLKNQPSPRVYLQEQVTPFYKTACDLLGSENVIGSEYLGPSLKQGSEVNGLRHEDAEHLSFHDAEFHAVVSNDVLEHVNDLYAALLEMRRVLVPGGIGLVSIPLHTADAKSERRARFNQDGTITHYAEPEYHGNYILESGSLVYTDIGWDILATALSAGFSSAVARGYWSLHHGHLGGGLQIVLIFRC